MTEKTEETIRASEADIVVNCGLAATAPEHEIDDSGPEAALGQAVHASLEQWVGRGMADEPEAQPHANEHGVDVQAVEDLIARAPEAIRSIRHDLTGLRAEVDVRGGYVRGRVDALSLRMAAGKLFSTGLIDWKTGRDPNGSKPAQRLAYASAVEAHYGMPAQRVIYTAEIWLATGDILEARYDIDSIQGFRARLADRLKGKRAAPGAHCRYCRRRFECVERDTYLRASGRALAELDGAMPTPDALAALWDQSRALRTALERYDKAVDAMLAEHEHLTLPDGRRLVHKAISRDNIDARKAWPVMAGAGLNQDDINATLSISKTKLLERIGAKAARGQKQKAKADLMIRLDEAGAIQRTVAKRRTII